jgi:hypothetical protein
MSVQLALPPVFQGLGFGGLPLPGGKLFTYIAGTTTPQATYTDSTQTTQNTNPVILNANGQANVWLVVGQTYKLKLTDFIGNQIWVVDQIPGGLSAQQIGMLFYPQTSAEQSAGITPINFIYPPGNILRYGTNTLPGTTDMSVPIQNSINQWANGGAPVYVPSGNYLQLSSASLTATTTGRNTAGDGFVMYGDGMGASTITTPNDIENLLTVGANSSHFLFQPYIHDLGFINTFPVNGNPQIGATHHHIHLANPLSTTIEKVYCKGNFGDSFVGVTANQAGIWLDNQGFGATFTNTIDTCWMDHAHITCDTSDSIIRDNNVTANGLDYGIKVNNSNINISDQYDLNCNGAHGGVWLTGNSALAKVLGNFFDTDCSHGIWADQTINCVISNNIYWMNQNAAIWLVNPSFFTITGNSFLNCGQADTGINNSDIVFDVTAFASFNTVVGNVAQKTNARSGGAVNFIYELNAGSVVQNNRYIGNTVESTAGQYATPAINLSTPIFNQGSVLVGNVGSGTETETYTTFTGTLTGCTAAVTAAVRATRQGNLVTLYLPTIQGTSNTNACTMTGIPAALQPANTQYGGNGLVSNNSANVTCSAAVDATGTLTFNIGGNNNGFTTSGTKGPFTGYVVAYQLT